MPDLTEDDIYRTSTQYRQWSFTRQSLASLRATTNETAANGVRAAIKGLQSRNQDTDVDSRPSNDNGHLQNNAAKEVDCLTVEEERKLVGYYCLKCMQLADFCDFPTNVKATAVQFLKRFYLSNSPMTYHPKEILPAALFLATKTENHYTSLKSFVEKLPKTTAEDVIAPEFLLTQGLRFTFDVRHPHRGLEGGYMELITLATGKGSVRGQNTNAEQIQKDMLELRPAKGGNKTTRSVGDIVSRIQYAHSKAKDVLKTSALLSDAYFLYTPSQIWLSSLLLADEALASFYIDTKFVTSSKLTLNLMTALHSCADLLRSSASAEPGDTERRDLTKIDKKLYKCRNPEKLDLISINKAQKREGEGEGELDEKKMKKRKMEREKSEKEAEDVFGPALGSKG